MSSAQLAAPGYFAEDSGLQCELRRTAGGSIFQLSSPARLRNVFAFSTLVVSPKLTVTPVLLLA